jgi:hypothetical protein
MRIEINDALSSVLITVVIVAGIVGVVLGIGYMVHTSNVKNIDALSKAKSCEEAVLLQGGQDTTNRLVACKIQTVPVAPVTQSGK